MKALGTPPNETPCADRDDRAGPPNVADLETWLAERENRIPNLRPIARKRILWAGAPGQQTPLSVVYVHGFSASAEELRPVPDRLADALGANLYFARLSGHGRDGEAMAEPRIGDLRDDVAEAIQIGKRIGNRTLVLGTSMGGALTSLAVLDPAVSKDIAGVALFAPAFRLPWARRLPLSMPFLRQWGPLLLGKTRTLPARSEAHAAAWTLSYPLVSVLPVADVAREAAGADLSLARPPAIFFYSRNDTIVVPQAIARAAAKWGGPAEVVELTMGPTDDTYAHVIAGDALSPGQTDDVADRLIAWARKL